MQQNLYHTNLVPPKFDTRPPTAYNSGFSKITVHSVHYSFQTTSVFRIPFFSNTTVKNHARFRTTNPTHFQTLGNGRRTRHGKRQPFPQTRPRSRHCPSDDEAGRKLHLLRYTRNPARRLRLFTQRRHFLPRGPRRHLRLPHTNPSLQPAYGRHHRRQRART